MKIKIAFGVVFIGACIIGATLVLSGDKTAREIWNDAIKRCATNDQIGPNVVYFGPSNKFGPGTTFLKYETGGIQVSDLPADYGLPADAIVEGEKYSCDILTKTGFEIDADAPLTSFIGVPADLDATIKSAKHRNVTTRAIQWVELKNGAFRRHMRTLPNDHDVKLRLEQGEFILARALRVQGLEATITFEGSIASKVKASLPSTIAVGQAGDVKLDVAWKDESTMILKSPSDFYIAGELRRFVKGGLASAADAPIGPLVEDQGKFEVRHVKQR